MVDIILAETASVELTRDYNFVERQGRKEFFVGVVELQRHFAVGHTFAVFGACKNDVLHAFAAQRLGALFAERPSYSVRDVGFSASVRTDNCGDTLLKRNFHLIGKGFETSQFDFLKLHVKFCSV